MDAKKNKGPSIEPAKTGFHNHICSLKITIWNLAGRQFPRNL